MPFALSIGDPMTAITIAVAMIILNIGTDIIGEKVYRVAHTSSVNKAYKQINPNFCPSYCAINHLHLAHKAEDCTKPPCNHWVID